MKAPHGKKGPKPLQKGSGTLFGGVFAGFLALDASKKVFEHFLIDILWCLNILNNISKIEKNHTVPLKEINTFYDVERSYRGNKKKMLSIFNNLTIHI